MWCIYSLARASANIRTFMHIPPLLRSCAALSVYPPGWYHSLSKPCVSVKHLPLYSSHSIQCLKSRRLQSHSQGFCPSSRCWRLASGSKAALSNPRSLFPARDSHLWNSQNKGDLAFAQHKIPDALKNQECVLTSTWGSAAHPGPQEEPTTDH